MKTLWMLVFFVMTITVSLTAQSFPPDMSEMILKEKEGHFDEAIEGYRVYLKNHPDNYPVAVRLINLLFRTKEYSEIISLYSELTESLQERREVIAFLGRAYIYNGNKKEGINKIKSIIEKEGKTENSYSFVGNTFLGLGLIVEAQRIFQEGRKKLGGKRFARELFHCFSRQENYSEALREIVNYFESKQISSEWIKKEILRLIEKDNSLLEKLEKIGEEERKTQKLAGEIFLEFGDMGRAKSLLIKVFDVQSLLHFSSICIREGYFSEAEETLNEVIHSSAGVGEKEEARFLLSKVFVSTSRFDGAIGLLNGIIEQGYAFKDSAVVEKTRILIEYKKDFKSGIQCIKPFLDNKNLINRAGILRLAVIGYINGDNLDEAENVLRKSSNPYSFYLLGEVLFLRGEYDDACKAYLSAVSKCLDKDFANDALEKVLIIEFLKSRMTFINFIREVEGDIWKEKYEEVISKINVSFNEFSEIDEKVVLLFYKGMIYSRMGKMNEAISSYTSVKEEDRDSPFSPKALYRAAVIYKTEIKNKQLAEELFRDVIFEYPESVEAELARTELSQSQ